MRTYGIHDGRAETEKQNRMESRERTIQYGQIIDKDANVAEQRKKWSLKQILQEQLKVHMQRNDANLTEKLPENGSQIYM